MVYIPNGGGREGGEGGEGGELTTQVCIDVVLLLTAQYYLCLLVW